MTSRSVDAKKKVINGLSILVFATVTVLWWLNVSQFQSNQVLSWFAAIFAGFFSAIIFLSLTVAIAYKVSPSLKAGFNESVNKKLLSLLGDTNAPGTILFQSNPAKRVNTPMAVFTGVGIALFLGTIALFVISLFSDTNAYMGDIWYLIAGVPLMGFLTWLQGGFLRPKTQVQPGAYFQILPGHIVLFPGSRVVSLADVAEVSLSRANYSSYSSIIAYALQIVDLRLRDGSIFSFKWITPRVGISEDQAYKELYLKELFQLVGFTLVKSTLRTAHLVVRS